VRREIKPHRLQLQSYPHHLRIDTQFADMDVYGHINNLAIGRFFESARARFQLKIYDGHKPFTPEADYRMLLVENNMRFLTECHFPDPVDIGTGIDHIGNSAYSFQHGLFQNGRCVALAEAAMVAVKDGAPAPLPAHIRRRLEQMLVSSA
jgi:acyl-CoA thioester hydrolase